ncbi:MAG: CocE/NonD family hydrolase [Actinomycetota bacterium]
MTTREHVAIEMDDGVRLAATLYLPDGEGSWPAVLEALPYRKDDVTGHSRTEYRRLAEAGYVLCRVDVRGTGSSEGIATDEYPPVERTDLITVIDWLASQPWSAGAVGMYGYSYSGFNSIQLAMERPPALKAVIPIYATDDRFGDDVHYFGGVLKQLDQIDYPTYMVAMNALPPVPSIYGDGWREEWARRLEGAEPWILTWLEHQRLDDYWKAGSLFVDYEAIECPTMIVAGWADGYRNNTLRTFERLRCPKRLVIGPWAHAATDTSLPGPNHDLIPEHIRWWDRWLKDIDNGIDREPPIVLFAQRSTMPAPDRTRMRGGWRFEPTWPADRLTPIEWPLELAETNHPEVADGRDVLEVRGDVGHTAWISCAGVLPWGQPDDQRPDELHSLTYTWAPLEQELEILGHARLRVRVTSSAPVAFLSAKLCDVFPDGTSSLAARGMLNLTHRDSRERPSALTAGEPVDVQLELEATSWTFEPGHRVRLDLAGTDWPNAWSPPAPVTLTIDRGATLLELPVLEGPSPVSERPTFPPPFSGDDEEAPSSQQPGSDDTAEEHSSVVRWSVTHEPLTRITSANAGSTFVDAATSDLPAMRSHYDGVVSVSTLDPGRAVARGEAEFEMRWDETTVVSRTDVTIESDAETFRTTIDLVVHEDGEERYRRRWERAIPRDLA